jgi:hypothetical protein
MTEFNFHGVRIKTDGMPTEKKTLLEKSSHSQEVIFIFISHLERLLGNQHNRCQFKIFSLSNKIDSKFECSDNFQISFNYLEATQRIVKSQFCLFKRNGYLCPLGMTLNFNC